MPHLGQSGQNLNEDIKSLVREGLGPTIQRALDTVRVVGNNAVHPGEITFGDTKQTAGALFSLLNFIVERMITHKKELDKLYEALPDSSRDAIARRDAAAQPGST